MSFKMTKLYRVPKTNKNKTLLRLEVSLKIQLYHMRVPIKVLRNKSRCRVQSLKSREKKSKSSLSSTRSRGSIVNRNWWIRSLKVTRKSWSSLNSTRNWWSRSLKVTRKLWNSSSFIRNRSLKAMRRCRKSSTQSKVLWSLKSSKIMSNNKWFSN